MSDDGLTCDGCGEPLHVDRNGWYVGEDGSSDCPVIAEGHLIDGRQR